MEADSASAHPGVLMNPGQHVRPLNSPVSLLNDSVTPSMCLCNFLDDHEDGHKNGGESLDFLPVPGYVSGQVVAPSYYENSVFFHL